MGGWVGGWVEKKEGMRYCGFWVGGWVGGFTWSLLLRKTMKTVSTSSGILEKMKSITHRPEAPSPYAWEVGGWVGG